MPNIVSKNKYLNTYELLVNRAAPSKGASPNIKRLLQYARESEVSTNTKRNYLNSIVAVRSIWPEMVRGSASDFSELLTYRDELSGLINSAIERGDVNDNQRKALSTVSLSDLQGFVSELREKYESSKSFKDLDNYLLVNMMVTYPVRNDLADILLTRSTPKDKEHNYLLCKKQGCTLWINKHKTAESRGAINIQINPEISALIKTFVGMDPKRKYLFMDSNDEPYTSSSFYNRLSGLFNKRFGVRISSTLLRKIIDSAKFGKINKEERDMAAIQGHSVETQRRIYTSTQPWVKRSSHSSATVS